MAVEIRTPTGDEWPAWVASVDRAFGLDPAEHDLEDWKLVSEADRLVGAFDGDTVVGNAGAYSLQLTLPGGTSLPAAGVTAVGVATTHRRQGVLTAMMGNLLDQAVDRGEPLAILWASEAPIYGRYGYGCASDTMEVHLDARPDTVAGPPDTGRVQVVEPGDVAKTLPPVYERYRRAQPGAVSRHDGWWAQHTLDREHRRKGGGARRYVVHLDAHGTPDGYLSYRTTARWSDDNLPDGTVSVEDLCAPDPVAAAALWRFACSVDLMPTVRARVPVDGPLRWLLADARAARPRAVADNLWVRILDVEAVLGTRRYPVAGRLTLQVADRFRPGTTGTYRLEAEAGDATCRRVDDDTGADLTLDVADLGAVSLGGTRVSSLAAAGRIVGEPAAVALADALFSSTPTPHCNTGF